MPWLLFLLEVAVTALRARLPLMSLAMRGYTRIASSTYSYLPLLVVFILLHR